MKVKAPYIASLDGLTSEKGYNLKIEFEEDYGDFGEGSMEAYRTNIITITNNKKKFKKELTNHGSEYFHEEDLPFLAKKLLKYGFKVKYDEDLKKRLEKEEEAFILKDMQGYVDFCKNMDHENNE